MKRFILFISILIVSQIASAQVCDPVNGLSVTSVSNTNASFSFGYGGSTQSHWSVVTWPAQVLVASGTTNNTFLTVSGLTGSTAYHLRIRAYCPLTSNFSTMDSVAFTTATSQITYTPQTAAGYRFKYLVADSGFTLPFGSLSLGRGTDRPGTLKINSADSLAYYFNGAEWRPLATDSAGVMALLNNKVDSVTLYNDSLFYWVNGVSTGYIFAVPASGLQAVTDVGNVTTDTMTSAGLSLSPLDTSAKFNITKYSTIFQGVKDFIYQIGYNVKDNGVEDATKTSNGITWENNYVDAPGGNRTNEWFTTMQSAYGLNARRPIFIKFDQVTGTVNQEYRADQFLIGNNGSTGGSNPLFSILPIADEVRYNPYPGITSLLMGGTGLVLDSMNLSIKSRDAANYAEVSLTNSANRKFSIQHRDISAGDAGRFQILHSHGGKVLIDSFGFLGINMAPQYPIDITTTGTTPATVGLTSTSGNTRLVMQPNGVFKYDIGVTPAGNYYMYSAGLGDYAMYILNAGNVGINNSSPNASAQLDIASTTKGLLIPRMNNAQRQAISSPATGLITYSNETNKLYHYNGSAHVPFVDSVTALTLGQNIFNTNGILTGARYLGGDEKSLHLGYVDGDNWIDTLGIFANEVDAFVANRFTLETSNGTLQVGNNSTSSAAFQMNSITGGFLPPRMTNAQMDAVVLPTEGLIVYNTDENKLYQYNGTYWAAMLDESDTEDLTSETTTASTATLTPTGDAKENYADVTALATNLTIAAPSGTAANHNTLLIRIKDNGTARTLTWNAIYRAGTDFALPTTTVINKTMYISIIRNEDDTKWDVVGLSQGY